MYRNEGRSTCLRRWRYQGDAAIWMYDDRYSDTKPYPQAAFLTQKYVPSSFITCIYLLTDTQDGLAEKV